MTIDVRRQKPLFQSADGVPLYQITWCCFAINIYSLHSFLFIKRLNDIYPILVPSNKDRWFLCCYHFVIKSAPFIFLLCVHQTTLLVGIDMFAFSSICSFSDDVSYSKLTYIYVCKRRNYRFAITKGYMWQFLLQKHKVLYGYC